MKKKNRLIDQHTKLRLEEELASLSPRARSMGVGQDLMEQAGLPPATLVPLLASMDRQAPNDDTLFMMGELKLADKTLIVFLKREGQLLEAGTRRDFEELGYDMRAWMQSMGVSDE